MRPIWIIKRSLQLIGLVGLTLTLVFVSIHHHGNSYTMYIDTKRGVMAATARKPVFNLNQKTLWVAQSPNHSNNTKSLTPTIATNGKSGHAHKQLEEKSLRPCIITSSHSPKTSGNASMNSAAKQFHVETQSPALTIDITNHASFMNVSVSGHYVFLFTAIVSKSSRRKVASWDRIVIQGFEDAALTNYTYTCCVLYASGTLRASPMLRKVQWYRRTKLGVRQFICPNRPKFSGDSPVRVTLSTSICHGHYDAYLRTEFAYRHVKQMAVCTKIAYGNLPAEDIISWFEVHKRLGISKVLTYTYKLNEKAVQVLRHYETEGMAEVIAFALPPHVPGSRWRAIGTKNSQAYNDEQLAVFDCLERLKGYAFIATIDFDEYLIPTRDNTLIAMMNQLLLHRPHAAGFKFYVKLHVTSWEPTDNTTSVKIGRYLHRTEALPDRMKHVALPNRLGPGGLGTHSFTPRAGYKTYYAPLQLGAIHHFRPCRKEWMENNSSVCFERPRYIDDAVAKLYRQAENKIFDMKSYLDV